MGPSPSAGGPAAPSAAPTRVPAPGARRSGERCGCSRLVPGPRADRLANRDAAHVVLGLHDGYLYPQDAVVIGSPRAIGIDVGAQLDLAPERAVFDFDLLVEAARRVGAAPLARD